MNIIMTLLPSLVTDIRSIFVFGIRHFAGFVEKTI